MLIEAAILLVVGLAVAAYANWNAKESIDLRRQYNRVLIDRQKAKESGAEKATENGASTTQGSSSVDGSTEPSKPKDEGGATPVAGTGETREPTPTVASDPPAKPAEPKRIDGFLVAGLREVLDAVQMSAEVPELFLILDARSWDHYIEGHIPGAISMSFYSVDAEQVEALRDRLEANPTVYIYCNGGDCTDSTGLAHELLGHCSDLGIPLDADFVRVYEEGMNEFKKLHPDLVVTGESPR